MNEAFCCDPGRYGVLMSNGVGVTCRDNGQAKGSKEIAVPEIKDPDSNCTDTSSSTISEAAASATNGSTETSPEKFPSDNPISPGAIAGVVVGSLAGVGLIAVLAFWFFRRRSQNRNQAQLPPQYQSQEKVLKAEAGLIQGQRAEVEGSQVCELPGDVRHSPELPGDVPNGPGLPEDGRFKPDGSQTR